jgi:hypothetical protein
MGHASVLGKRNIQGKVLEENPRNSTFPLNALSHNSHKISPLVILDFSKNTWRACVFKFPTKKFEITRVTKMASNFNFLAGNLKFHGGYVFFENYEGKISEISGKWSPTLIQYSNSIFKHQQANSTRNSSKLQAVFCLELTIRKFKSSFPCKEIKLSN